MAEKILVVKAKALEEAGLKFGLTFDYEKLGEVILNPDNALFMDRDEVETDPEYKQVISYIIFGYADDSAIFTYRRATDGRETRLCGARAIGVGGHVNDFDCRTGEKTFEQCYMESVRRELKEELIIDTPILNQYPIGIIYNDMDDVGKVHVGFVHYIELAEPKIWPKSPEIAGHGWMAPGYALAEADTFEFWSRTLLENWQRIREIVTEKK
jgi:predicted NUDIX family phosphoesterase